MAQGVGPEFKPQNRQNNYIFICVCVYIHIYMLYTNIWIDNRKCSLINLDLAQALKKN
jgi:hypothetical protein